MIHAEDITLVIDRRRILDGIGFDVKAGESVALVGPNGSGKTSILRAILGLVPFTGRITVGGRDAVREPIAARMLVGYLPQRPAFGNGTAREVLLFTTRLRGGDVSKVDGALARVGLAAHANQSARTFSGGMQQRLSLALALLSEAPVLLLDEPTASLDREGQESFVEAATQLRTEGRTLLLALHRAEEISRFANRVLQLENGCLISL